MELTPKPSPPILLLVFNRPESTEKVIAEVRKARPERFYVAADGPRTGIEGEAERCAKTRATALAVDWPCEVRTLLRDSNLGCMKAVSSAISWFFEQEPEGIILEDDCLPDQSFFVFCDELLARYRNDRRIMHIGGNNFQNGNERGDGSYYFSRYNHIWGWASWKRAWEAFDHSIQRFPEFLYTEEFKEIFPQEGIRRYWTRQFELLRKGQIDTWDYYWAYSIWRLDGLCIIPNVNLVSNIGFQSNSTHTSDPHDPLANLSRMRIGPIVHPSRVEPSLEADLFTFDFVFSQSIIQRLKRRYRRGL